LEQYTECCDPSTVCRICSCVGWFRLHSSRRVLRCGTHETRELNGLTDADTIRSHNVYWYDPTQNWASETWDDYYSISTGYFKSSSVPDDPSWKWGEPWRLPYDWSFGNGQTVTIGDQAFLVSGPYSGYTAFGKAVQYWKLINRDKFLYWDSGGNWKQYVHLGYNLVVRRCSARLELYSNILRRYYYRGTLTSYTVQYIENLTSSNSFPSVTSQQDIKKTGEPREYHLWGTPVSGFDCADLCAGNRAIDSQYFVSMLTARQGNWYEAGIKAADRQQTPAPHRRCGVNGLTNCIRLSVENPLRQNKTAACRVGG